ncbi:CTLH/CRA C-terminal to lish motif domain-containing protein [Pseudomassariella vexata]|uniref:GID complex catalytic subunit 2 n=1 Tax=Pseudomassariella vexata TaxID=1141098 RepID=A0A1Y2D8B1_9PEZI|nr:CTLH/CRA C-terminal to lish motif domain-containing protein [Pseudomassariella vexata]ORY55498.1 CTLH/CRA C-terminal to lish motif domain-domain-containing protein [Pseudomassariella vexata]
MAMLQLDEDLKKLTQSAQLSNALGHVDNIIDLLTNAREKIATANDPHTTSLTLTKLQNPTREGLEGVNEHLRNVHRAQTKYNKALTAAFEPKDKNLKGPLPTNHDPMADHPQLINRAIAMHLLREGQFGVASTFISEAEPGPEPGASQYQRQTRLPPSTLRSPTSPRSPTPTDATMDAEIPVELQSEALQTAFSDMYSILSSLKAHDLFPAIDWAHENAAELEARGSNLEFELCKLQFIWLFKGPQVNGLPDSSANGRSGALDYAQRNFSRFRHRHLREIQQLSCAMVYASNLGASPYRVIFDTTLAFDEVAASFTREFCSLLGLSAESPLYIAATAGTIALPQLMRFLNKVKGKNTEWTTEQELAFETPLPKSMIYHSIFVCPVSKEQTTDANPPMMLPCGHVLARESLQRMTKNGRFKCPYCPNEGSAKDSKEIIL